MNNEEFLQLVEKVYAFHTRRAPGIPIAVEMVLRARAKLGNAEKLCAVAETSTCLPDAIQFLLGCTIGNGDLRMMPEIGRYALTLYDRKNGGKGVRIFVDQNRIDAEKMPETHRFFLRKRSEEVKKGGAARKASAEVIVNEFLNNGRDIFSLQDVVVADTSKPPLKEVVVCPKCGESFSVTQPNQTLCLVCSSDNPYYRTVNS